MRTDPAIGSYIVQDPELKNFETLSNDLHIDFVMQHVKAFGNHDSSLVLKRYVGRASNVTYHWFLVVFKLSLLANTVLDGFFEQFGEALLCKSNRRMHGCSPGTVDNVFATQRDSLYGLQYSGLTDEIFCVGVLKGRHKFRSLVSKLAFKGIGLLGIFKSKGKEVLQFLRNWMGNEYGSELEFGDFGVQPSDEKVRFSNKLLMECAEKYMCTVDELAYVYYGIRRNETDIVLPKGRVVSKEDIALHKQNALLLMENANCLTLFKNACAHSERALAFKRDCLTQFEFMCTRLLKDAHKCTVQGALNVINYLAYQGITGGEFLQALYSLLFHNKKGSNMLVFYGSNKGCGKTSLASAIAKFVGEVAYLNFSFVNQFWGSNCKGKKLCVADQILNWNNVVEKEEYFDGVIPKPVEQKNMPVSACLFPPILLTTNIQPPEDLCNERLLVCKITTVISRDSVQPFPFECPEQPTIKCSELTPLTGKDIRSFLLVGLFLKDLDWLYFERNLIPNPWVENSPISSEWQNEFVKDPIAFRKVFRLFGLHLGRHGLRLQGKNTGDVHKNMCDNSVMSFEFRDDSDAIVTDGACTKCVIRRCYRGRLETLETFTAACEAIPPIFHELCN